MPFALRPLEARDIHHCALIEREAFPTLFPPTSFSREMENRLASYFVAFSLGGSASKTAARRQGEGLVGTLFRSARSAIGRRDEPPITDTGEYLVGFLGIWHMVDEAHVVSVGVRNDFRGRGIGELLLIGGIEHSIQRGSEVVTLEVRKSNVVAINLYQKYGFKERGVRKAYYADNREDALILTTDCIRTAAYRESFDKAVKEHEQSWGRSERRIAGGG